MRTKRRLILAAVLVILLVAFAWLVLMLHEPPGPPEPVYKGKPLGYWLLGLGNSGTNLPTSRQGVEAVSNLGTNAIPTLLRWLRAHDPAWKLKLAALVQKQHLVEVSFVPATLRIAKADNGFLILSSKASNAVPELVIIFERQDRFESVKGAATALAYIGPAAKDAVPALIRGTTNASVEVRRFAVYALARIHSEPALVLPVLIKCIKDPDAGVQNNAVSGLVMFGAEVKPAVPALIELLKDPDTNVRAQAGMALKHIDPEAAPKAGIK